MKDKSIIEEKIFIQKYSLFLSTFLTTFLVL